MDPADIILNLAIAVPPPGVIQNFINPESQAPRVIIVAAVMTVIMTLFTSVRFYTKIFIKRKFTRDDGRFTNYMHDIAFKIALNFPSSLFTCFCRSPLLRLQISYFDEIQLFAIIYTATTLACNSYHSGHLNTAYAT